MGTNYDAKITSKVEAELKQLNIEPSFSENALKILEKRYLMKDDDGNVTETPKDMLARVAANIAFADTFYGASYEDMFEFAKTAYAMMSNLEFLPNSPALRGAGRETQQLSACFVLPIEDSRKSIFETLRDAVDIQAYGGGCVDGNSNVYIEGKGLCKISSITDFDKIDEFGKPYEINGLETISYDRTLDRFVRSKITHVWKFNVPIEQQRKVIFKKDSSIITSEWHPFVLNDGSEKKAKDLILGDKILVPTERSAISINGVDADFDWLMGYFYGDGSIDESVNGTRVRFFDKNEEILKRAISIVERYTGISYSLQKDPRTECRYFCLTAKLDSQHGNSDEKVRNFIKRIKEYNIRTDVKNPIYFLAGFFDAEGYWGHDSSAFSNSNEGLIQYIRELCSLCGINTSMRKRTNSRGHTWYEVKFANFHLKRLPTVKTGRIPQGGTVNYVEVQNVEIPDSGDTTFYDFTVDKYNNYLAGQGLLVVVHNTGFNFSHIRAKGTKVESTGGAASGPISFMQIYDIAVGKVIAQGGVRQGANMGILAYNHPDVLEFIDAKMDGKTLSNFNISVGVNEEFMELAEKGLEYDLIDPHTQQPLKRVNAKEVLDKIANNAWFTGDPGLIFLDRINKANPTPHLGVIESTNPCITGDTLVAVADGRNSIPIKQLADEGSDVPVFCMDDAGKLTVRMMRNPRLTGINKKIVKVKLDDGNFLRVTENHKFILSDGTVKQAIELSEGDSLSIMQKMNARLDEVYRHSNSRSQEYSWLRSTNHYKWLSEHRIIVESHIGRRLKHDQVVHHKNYYGLDNRIENLEIMSKTEHNDLHAKNMIGDNNPMRRFPEKNWMNDSSKQQVMREKYHIGAKRKPETRELISEKAQIRNADPEYRKHLSKKTTEFWKEHPEAFDNGFAERSKRKLAECRAKTDLKCFLVGNSVMIEKVCEGCGIAFVLSWSDREICYHSPECYLNSFNSKKENRERLTASVNRAYEEKMGAVKTRQVKCYKELKDDLEREPWLKEFQEKCREAGLSHRFGTKYGFDSYKALKESATVLNHKVVSIEFDGYEDVYNGTVDEFHNFYIGGFDNQDDGKSIQSWMVNFQCGEIPLLSWESCNLGSVNLFGMVQEKKGKFSIDYDKLAEIVKNGVHFLDNVIDMNKYPIEKIEQMTKTNRKIGFGVMGWADTLAILGIPYDSDEALQLADKVMGFINTKAKEASVEIAKTRGVFPSFNGSIHDTGKEEDKVRHASWTTIAPTGTLSTLSDCNGGIEPFFMIVYSRGSIYDSDGKPTIKMLVENEVFKRIAIKGDFYSEELMANIAETGSVQHVDGVPDNVKKIFVTSHDISYEWHLKMQSAFQKHVTNAVSKTINFPNDAKVEDIKESYILAHKLGNIKGITVYRDGCKQHQVLSAVETKKEEKKPPKTDLEELMDKINAPRPRKIAGATDRIETPVGKLYVTINKANGKYYEVFLNIGKAGADVTADAEGYGRLLSMLFKIGIPPEVIVDQLRGIGGSGSIGFGKERVRSLPDGIARVLEILAEENTDENNQQLNGNNNGEPRMSGNMCPECGNMLVFEEGCTKCRNCGYSRC
jgi:ribonucleotide reductase alpha subunit